FPILDEERSDIIYTFPRTHIMEYSPYTDTASSNAKKIESVLSGIQTTSELAGFASQPFIGPSGLANHIVARKIVKGKILLPFRGRPQYGLNLLMRFNNRLPFPQPQPTHNIWALNLIKKGFEIPFITPPRVFSHPLKSKRKMEPKGYRVLIEDFVFPSTKKAVEEATEGYIGFLFILFIVSKKTERGCLENKF
ncbi:hypothetical protein BB560_006171, partial [Smittium megazygosporum]